MASCSLTTEKVGFFFVCLLVCFLFIFLFYFFCKWGCVCLNFTCCLSLSEESICDKFPIKRVSLWCEVNFYMSFEIPPLSMQSISDNIHFDHFSLVLNRKMYVVWDGFPEQSISDNTHIGKVFRWCVLHVVWDCPSQ